MKIDHELFTSWPENESLGDTDLWLNADTFLARTLMLRPSDFAPNGVIFYDSLGLTLRQNVTFERLVLEQNHMNVTFFVS